MRKRTLLLGLLAALGGMALAPTALATPYVLTINQVGSTVVASGSGAIDSSGTTNRGNTTGIPSNIQADVGYYGVGVDGSNGLLIYSINQPVGGRPSGLSSADAPMAYGNGTGAPVLFYANQGNLYLSSTYGSDAPLGTSASTFNNATLVSLDLNEGLWAMT